MPQDRPRVQHAHSGHRTYYNHFDDREQGNVLLAMGVGAGMDTHEDAQPPIAGTYYRFMEQFLLENGIADCDCTAYSPISLVPDPSSALDPANVPVRVANRQTSKELHHSEWDLDFDVEESLDTLSQDGEHSPPLPERVHIPVNQMPERTTTVGSNAQWLALTFMMIAACTSANPV